MLVNLSKEDCEGENMKENKRSVRLLIVSRFIRKFIMRQSITNASLVFFFPSMKVNIRRSEIGKL